ncbi:hypothetical protein WJX84_005045 [Apatococcus fuscideae]|uniref:Translation initiation factor IF- 2 domain-containing protein n=1 Tax=Apatococcus fuscideae TaxID=2026836 RepID=A0AAW1SZL7_9CHLO
MSGVSLRHATGSAEALQEALSTDTVCIKILHMGVGPVSKANINKTALTNARIIAFNVKTDGLGLEAANKVAGVQGLLHPQMMPLNLFQTVSHPTGSSVNCWRTYKRGPSMTSKVLTVTQKGEPATSVAGCRISSGMIAAVLSFQALRNEQELGVERVGRGTECGLLLTGFAGFQPGDQVHCFEI